MTRPRRTKASFAFVALATIVAGCRYATVPESVVAAHTMVAAPSVAVVAAEDAGAATTPELRATYFPATHGDGRPRPVVVLFDPVLWKRSILHRGSNGGLVPYLNYHGFAVWLVFAEDYRGVTMRAAGEALARALPALAKKPGTVGMHIGGTSLGGDAVAYALDVLAAGDGLASLPAGKVFFLGAGVDYAFPASFAEAAEPYRDKPAAVFCQEAGGDHCHRYLDDGAAASKWLGYLPPSSGDERRPAAERFAHLRTLQRPALFISGKADGVCPSESLFPLYELYGSAAGEDRFVPKLFLFAGRENHFVKDYDQYGLFGASSAEDDVYLALRRWLERR